MGRKPRYDYPGALWHITSRGVDSQAIYRNDHDRDRFLDLLQETIGTYGWSLHSYVLMGNHYHLLVSTDEGTISKGMRYLNGEYACSFNEVYGREGHLFERRFRGHLVEEERYLLNVARYVVLNPVRAGITASPGQWKWSSYNATSGLTDDCSWLTTSMLLSYFHPTDIEEARVHFRSFVDSVPPGTLAPWTNAIDGFFIGTPEFARVSRKRALLHKVV